MLDLENPPPVPFDWTLENRPFSAQNSPLFKLPLEILNNIGSQLSTYNSDLSSLALVNTYCRQLARSWQFRIVNLDDSLSSENLVKLLFAEAVERSLNQGRTKSLSLGACVRQFFTDFELWKKLIDSESFNSSILIKENLDSCFDNKRRNIPQRQAKAGYPEESHNENYRPDLFFALSSLIHLQTLDIYGADLSYTLLKPLVALPLKHFSISYAMVYNFIPKIDIFEWPLENLEINLRRNFKCGDHRISNLNFSINWRAVLQSCAPFLQALKLVQTELVDISYFFEEPEEEIKPSVIKFPNLRHLNLYGFFFGSSSLRSFILTSPYLTNLAINFDIPNIKNLLDFECHIKSLKNLILDGGIRTQFEDLCFNFLERNSQLEGFGFKLPLHYTFLEKILRLFKELGHLKKISMIWQGSNSSESLLEELVSLTLIENLHLRSIIWRDYWVICHDTMLKSLRPLVRLKRLAFTKDKYFYNVCGTSIKYSMSRGCENFSIQDLHYQHIRERAMAYARAFPDLELLHIGNITFEILRVENDIKLLFTEDKYFSWETDILNMREWSNYF